MALTQTRRRFLTALSGAGAVGLAQPQLLAAEEALETTTVRFTKSPKICVAPQHFAEQLLHSEGFTDIV